MNERMFIDKIGQFCDDLDLLTPTDQGNEQDALFSHAFTKLKRFCQSKFNLPAEDAENFANQAILRFLERLSSKTPLELEDGKHFLNYLRKIARYEILSEIAKRPGWSHGAELTDLLMQSEKQLRWGFDRFELWAIVDKLDRGQAQILRLEFLHGYSLSEIGTVLGLSERQIKYRKSLALAALTEKLGISP